MSTSKSSDLSAVIAVSPKELKARNAAFNRLSKKKKRIAIANDILARIAAKQIVGESGVWAIAVDPKTNDLQEHLDGNGKCQCCALGAAICGVAFFKDQIELNYDDEASYGDNRDELRDIFGEKQLSLIENAFEGGDGYFNDDAYDWDSEDDNGGDLKLKPLYKKAISFGKRYNSDTSRLKAIWSNVVKNDGTFVP